MFVVPASESPKTETNTFVKAPEHTKMEVGEFVYGFHCGFIEDSERPYSDLGCNIQIHQVDTLYSRQAHIFNE